MFRHAKSTNRLDNVADLIAHLGGISPKRIRLHPSPGSATEADVLVAMDAPRKRLCELIDGVLVEKPMRYRESLLASYLIGVLQAFVLPRNLGLFTAPDGTVRPWAGRVRIPDIAYYSWGRLPGRKLPAEPIPTLAPDLAIEILRKSNTKDEMSQKRQDYFKVGVNLVWQIDPETQTVDVYVTPDDKTTLTTADTLDASAFLPGFTLALCDLFAELDRHG
jgi:Uma2 family endonuclease